MRVAITGSTNIWDESQITSLLEKILTDKGGRSGVDKVLLRSEGGVGTIANLYAQKYGYSVQVYSPAWDDESHEKRDTKIIEECDYLAVIWNVDNGDHDRAVFDAKLANQLHKKFDLIEYPF